MAKQIIPVNTSSAKFANNLVHARNELATAQSILKDLLTRMDNMVADPDYGDIATYFGVPSADTQALYNLVAGTVAEMAADTNLQALMARVG